MDNTRVIILEQILPLVPFDGWSAYALREAAKRAGVDEAALAQAFPRGIADCVEYFFTAADAALETAFAEGALAAKRVPERIEALVLARFDHWRGCREAARRAVAVQSLPWNAARGVAAVYRTVDAMWRLAGDASTDFSYYTKRATLAGVYSATMLCWLNDTSENDDATRQFLKRRLENVAAFGKWKKQFQGKKPKRWG